MLYLPDIVSVIMTLCDVVQTLMLQDAELKFDTLANSEHIL